MGGSASRRSSDGKWKNRLLFTPLDEDRTFSSKLIGHVAFLSLSCYDVAFRWQVAFVLPVYIGAHHHMLPLCVYNTINPPKQAIYNNI
jgi:hypothetical protein